MVIFEVMTHIHTYYMSYIYVIYMSYICHIYVIYMSYITYIHTSIHTYSKSTYRLGPSGRMGQVKIFSVSLWKMISAQLNLRVIDFTLTFYHEICEISRFFCDQNF